MDFSEIGLVIKDLITFWKYTVVDRKPYQDFLNVKEHKAYREYYQKAF